MGIETVSVGSGLSYEVAISRLKEVVRRLEGGEIPLEEALALFQEGVALVKACKEKLDAAEQLLELVIEEPGGETSVQVYPEAGGSD